MDYRREKSRAHATKKAQPQPVAGKSEAGGRAGQKQSGHYAFSAKPPNMPFR
jgi:hypothetical protein